MSEGDAIEVLPILHEALPIGTNISNLYLNWQLALLMLITELKHVYRVLRADYRALPNLLITAAPRYYYLIKNSRRNLFSGDGN